MSEWAFLLDENIDPKVAKYLEKESVSAVHVRETVGLGAEDNRIMTYARNEGLILVTSDVTDFDSIQASKHAGIVLLYDDTMPAYEVASALITLVYAYPGRSELDGHEILDLWA
jgi:predicted nuclease of predicted toxin-antitoxin system